MPDDYQAQIDSRNEQLKQKFLRESNALTMAIVTGTIHDYVDRRAREAIDALSGDGSESTTDAPLAEPASDQPGP